MVDNITRKYHVFNIKFSKIFLLLIIILFLIIFYIFCEIFVWHLHQLWKIFYVSPYYPTRNHVTGNTFGFYRWLFLSCDMFLSITNAPHKQHACVRTSGVDIKIHVSETHFKYYEGLWNDQSISATGTRTSVWQVAFDDGMMKHPIRCKTCQIRHSKKKICAIYCIRKIQ